MAGKGLASSQVEEGGYAEAGSGWAKSRRSSGAKCTECPSAPTPCAVHNTGKVDSAPAYFTYKDVKEVRCAAWADSDGC